MSESSILTAFIGSLEASVSVLLTVFYGAVAGYFGLVSTDKSAVDLSSLTVKLFLPCLLFVNVGEGFSMDNIGRFAPIIIWGFGYNIISIILGSTATRLLKLPAWVTAAVTFNNATSLPLLLLQSFAVSGALSSISAGDPIGAIARANTYFLINATISNTLTFSLGPRLLKADVEANDGDEDRQGDDVEERRISRSESGVSVVIDEDDDEVGERIPLIPNKRGRKRQDNSWGRVTGQFFYQFWNVPVLSACIGLFAGLVPTLHHHFFDKNGIFRAWLTVSLSTVGNMFAGTQVIIVGLKVLGIRLDSLHSTYAKMRLREDSGSMPLYPTICVLLTRFIIMPAISIPVIYVLAAKTHILSDDPILWFCMMVMPVGPSAMRLAALADVTKVDEREKMVIAKFLALSYVVTPMFCFAAVASLKACEMALFAQSTRL
ncbi:hypothetical protein GYMLUDRAFT_985216 [Collybiopsis luxurians FD-317 M1]|uniref:Auxin efflux carrier n=1 Tax=Collybiopsis luxurians FD-317 M1 TaxID=944289 RepID=A0A0D0CM87_9AGAR|nr:hypothetical protein GYMLUDRAFT_985216 [Collybiopsis luxurians FD-317 M1]